MVRRKKKSELQTVARGFPLLAKWCGFKTRQWCDFCRLTSFWFDTSTPHPLPSTSLPCVLAIVTNTSPPSATRPRPSTNQTSERVHTEFYRDLRLRAAVWFTAGLRYWSIVLRRGFQHDVSVVQRCFLWHPKWLISRIVCFSTHVL